VKTRIHIDIIIPIQYIGTLVAIMDTITKKAKVRIDYNFRFFVAVSIITTIYSGIIIYCILFSRYVLVLVIRIRTVGTGSGSEATNIDIFLPFFPDYVKIHVC
jgi:hypothetical protein